MKMETSLQNFTGIQHVHLPDYITYGIVEKSKIYTRENTNSTAEITFHKRNHKFNERIHKFHERNHKFYERIIILKGDVIYAR